MEIPSHLILRRYDKLYASTSVARECAIYHGLMFLYVDEPIGPQSLISLEKDQQCILGLTPSPLILVVDHARGGTIMTEMRLHITIRLTFWRENNESMTKMSQYNNQNNYLNNYYGGIWTHDPHLTLFLKPCCLTN